MSKEGTAAVVGIAGVATCGALIIAGGALILGGYLAIKGTCLAARGMFLLGKEAHDAWKRHQEDKRQQRLQELATERAQREEALRAQQQLLHAGIESVERRLALRRITQQAEAAQVEVVAQRQTQTLEKLRRDREALASEAALRQQELQALRAREARERAQRQEAYVHSLEQERQKLERLERELAEHQQRPPAPEEAERRLAEALAAEARGVLERLQPVPDTFRIRLDELQAQPEAAAYADVIGGTEAFIRDLYAHQTQQNLARSGDYTVRLQAHEALHEARLRLLSEDYLPTQRIQEWSQHLDEVEALLEQGDYALARERADQVRQAIEGYRAGRDVEELRQRKRQAEEALAEAQAMVEAVTDDEGLMQVLGALQQQIVIDALRQELERLTTAVAAGHYDDVLSQCQMLASRAQDLAEAAVTHFSQGQRDLIVATAADVLRELGYDGIEHTPVDGFEDSMLLSGFKEEMPFQVTVDLDGTVSIHVGHEQFPDQLACSQELDRFFEKMWERGITLRRGELRDTHPARLGEAASTPLDTLEREFEEILAEMGVQSYQKARSAEGVEFTAFLGSTECVVNIDHTGQATDKAGEQMSPDRVREQLQAERQRVAEQQRHATRRARGERLR
jgi:hypothetical protein